MCYSSTGQWERDDQTQSDTALWEQGTAPAKAGEWWGKYCILSRSPVSGAKALGRKIQEGEQELHLIFISQE